MAATDNDTAPQLHQKPVVVASDGHLEVPASVARQGARGSRRTVLVLGVSLFGAILAVGLYWLSQASSLDKADKQPGEVVASGQKVTDPAVTGTFHEPEPQPKQPSADQVARSSTPSPTLSVPPNAGESGQPSNTIR